MSLVGSELSALGSVLTAAGEDSPGAGPPVVVPTLAQVYAAGAGAPITDDLMAMLHGNMRFQSPVDSAPLPLLGYWENATGQSTAASGFPSELWSLAVIVGTDTGRRFSLFQMFDPAWNGTFSAINGMSWETERVTFTSDATNEYRSQNQNPAFGSRDWKIFNNFASVSYPQGASANGTVAHEVELYNTIDLGLRFIDRMDGWGQTDRELTPQSNGITWQWASHWNATHIVGAANDGIGWGVYAGDLQHTNHVQAGLTARQVTGDPQGDWYWSFLVSDGAGALSDIADFARSGITFSAPVVADNLLPVGTTALLSLTATADNIAISIPQRAGYYFCPTTARVFFKDGTGTATAGTLTVSYGNNVAHDNGGSTAFTTGQVNSALTFQPDYLTLGAGAVSMLDSSAAHFVKISAVPTGVTSMHGRVVVYGFWVPV